MKIALVTPYDYPYPGGVTEHIRHLDHEFRALGHETRIIAPSSTPENALDRNVIRVPGEVTPLRINGSTARINLSPELYQEVQALLTGQQFDVIHIHEPEVPMLSLMALVHSHAVTVGTFHAFMETSGWGAIAYPLMMLPVLERLDGRIFVSRPLREKTAPLFPGETRVIPNGIDYPFYASQDNRPIAEFNDGRPNILFVGRMDARKGFQHLLHAYPQIKRAFPRARLLVVGAYQPEEVAPFIEYAKSSRLDDIHFVGKVSADELRRFYRTATVFVAPSTGSESFGIVLLEAMATGAPVVASDIPGYRSVLTPGREGLLAAPGDEAALVGAITRLLGDPGLARRMSAQGRRTAQRYDWKIVAGQVLEYYRKLLETRRAEDRDPKRSAPAIKMQVRTSIKFS